MPYAPHAAARSIEPAELSQSMCQNAAERERGARTLFPGAGAENASGAALSF
jgi:hypothetical protein